MKTEKSLLNQGGKISAHNSHVFVVDDDESVCRSLGILLAAYGFGVDTFICAGEFFRAVPNNIPGCLLLDIHMPGMDGWETLQLLRSLGSDRPVIFMSADKNGGVKELALRSGVAGFLQKPFNDKELISILGMACVKEGDINISLKADKKNAGGKHGK